MPKNQIFKKIEIKDTIIRDTIEYHFRFLIIFVKVLK